MAFLTKFFVGTTSNEDSSKETQQFTNIATVDQDELTVGSTEWIVSSLMTEQNKSSSKSSSDSDNQTPTKGKH